MNTKTEQTEKPGATADKSAHTPGPWRTGFRWVGGKGIDAYVKIDSEHQGVAYAFGNSEHERDSNARLIAAAPEVLSALRAIVESYEAGDSKLNYVEYHNASVAIAAAEGSAQ